MYGRVDEEPACAVRDTIVFAVWQAALVLLTKEVAGGVPSTDRLIVMAITYFNLGTEQEFLREW